MAILAADELTRTYRREGLAPTLEHLLRESRATGAPLSLAVVDVDHFKTLNDGFGHAVGDAVLREAAARVRAALRDEDVVFRYGGDEFVVLLPSTTLSDAAAVLERVRRRVRERPIDAGATVRVQLSVGVACSLDLPGDAPTSALFERADARLLRAKRRGRDRLVADDEERGDGALPEVRLLGRDVALATLERFLDEPATGRPSGPGALRLTGPPGAGFGRMLREAASRARLRGRALRRVVGTPAGEGVHLAALREAFAPDEDRYRMDEEGLRARFREEADGPGLVLLVEGGDRLDADGRALVQALAARPGTWAVEACPDGARPVLAERERVELAPLGPRQLEAWLRALLAGAPSPALLAAAREVGGGRPGPTARWLRRGRRTGALRRGPEGWSWHEEVAPLHDGDDGDDADGPAVRIPRWDAPLMGRSALLARLRQELAEERLVVLVGPGGIGKSRLAAQLAHELADGAPGGTDWIDLRTLRRGDDLVAAIARDLDLGAVPDVGELARRLGDRPRRLVLDDAERIAGDAGQATELLAALPGLRLLATSRRPLRLDAERVVDVGGLDEPGQAAALLRRSIRRAAGRRAAPDPEAERALLAHLGGSPLAIELAAAWTRVLPPERLATALETRPGLLRDAPGLQARATETIDLTAELMSFTERETLGTLALLEGGFEAEEARRAVDASPFFLLALLDRGLVRRDGARYGMHALVAERFAATLSDPALARRRIAEAYAELAARLDDLGGEARSEAGYRRVDAEIDNFRLAWTTLLAPPRAEALWPLARLLRGWFDVRGRFREGLETFQAAEAALSEGHDRELRAWARESVALFLSHLGRHAEAERRADAALSLLAGRPPTRTAAQAHNTCGIARAYQGDVDGARAAFLRSAALRRELGDAVGEAQAHGNVALLLEQAGRDEEARAALRTSVRAYRDVGHASGLTLALSRLALLERRGTDTDPRAPASRAAPRATDRAPDRAPDRAARRDALAMPLALAREARDVADRIGYASAAEAAEAELAETLLASGRPDEALPHAARSLELARTLEAPARLRAARLRRGRALAEAGHLDAARAEADRLDRDGGDAGDDPDGRRGRLLLATALALAAKRHLDAGRFLGASEGGDDPDLDRWWRDAHAAWRAALTDERRPAAEAAFAEGRRVGPDALRPTGDERRSTAA